MDALAHSEDDDGLWDELSHQQSREIEQHYRVSRSSNPLSNLAFQARANASRLAYATSRFWNEQRQSNQRRRSLNSLQEFGIPDTGDNQSHDPLLPNNNESTTTPPPANTSGLDKDDPFVLLRQWLRRGEGWNAVANLDLFFTSHYSYFYHRGWWPIFLKGCVELISLFFTLWLSVALFVYVDWSLLITCTDETTCMGNLSDYLVEHPWKNRTLWTSLVLVYCLLFVGYGMACVVSFYRTLQDAFDSKHFFEDILRISPLQLQAGSVDWDRDVVAKIVELQTTGAYRIAIHGQDLDALVIAQRILRKENFMIAFFNQDRIPLLQFRQRPLYSRTLEFCFYFCVLNFMFNPKYQIRPAFYLDPAALRRRFVLCGVAHLLLMPFLLFFMTLHFSLQNVYSWKSSKERKSLPKDWTMAARWTMREFNELPHQLDRRLGRSHKPAEEYLKLFGQDELVAAVGSILTFMGGALGAVLIALAALNDSILLHVKIADWNLLWYAGVVGVVYSVGKSLLPSSEAQPCHTRNLFQEMDAALAQVATHTHYYPETWRGRGWDKATYKALTVMFQNEAMRFVGELLGVLLAPLVLCVSLPQCAEDICEFVLAVKKDVPGAGEVCGYSTFDFDQFADEPWEGGTLGESSRRRRERSPLAGSLTSSILRTGNVNEAMRMHPEKPKCKQGKMEKSFFSFKAAHPSWKCSESGQYLVDRVEKYKQEEEAALARERQLHIEGAARQLETLVRLEQLKNAQNTGVIPPLDESYIPRKQAATADAGAGSAHGGVPTEQQVPTPARTSTLPRAMDHTLQMVPEGEMASFSPAFGPQSSMTASLPPTPLGRPPMGQPPTSSSIAPVGRPPLGQTSTLGSSSVGPNNLAARTNASSGLLSTHRSRASVGLSTELRHILNMSTLDPDVSVSDSLLMAFDSTVGGRDTASEVADSTAERQYLWLERYHAHVASQQGATDGAGDSSIV